MFAIREIIENKLYAVCTQGEGDEFHDCFTNWQDVSYLRNFFAENRSSLHGFYRMDLRTAVNAVIRESNEFEQAILESTEGGGSLDETIFVPLHEGDDFGLPLVEVKAKGKIRGRSFLRVYAIRLSDGAYLVCGGIIKTTQRLSDSEQGRNALAAIRRLADYLRAKDIFDGFDLGFFVV